MVGIAQPPQRGMVTLQPRLSSFRTGHPESPRSGSALLDHIDRHFNVVLALGALTGWRPEHLQGFADLLISSDNHLIFMTHAAIRVGNLRQVSRKLFVSMLQIPPFGTR